MRVSEIKLKTNISFCIEKGAEWRKVLGKTRDEPQPRGCLLFILVSSLISPHIGRIEMISLFIPVRISVGVYLCQSLSVCLCISV